MHVFPKTFVVVMMHNCKAIFWSVSVQNRPFKTDHVHNRPIHYRPHS